MIVTLALDEPTTLMAVVGVVFLDRQVNDWLPVPGRRNIPTSVTGGIVAWAVLSPLVGAGWVACEFLERPAHLAAGDVFATVSMGACNRALAAGGRQLMVLRRAAALLIVLQNGGGTLVARYFH